MDAKELDALLARVAEGDNDAFGKFYAATAKGVFSFAYSYLGNREDAEDVMQSAYLTVKRRAYTDKKGTNARAWLLQIVKNLALDELRRWKRRGEMPENMPAPPAADGAALSYMLSSLNETEREIVVLHVYWGYKHREIARLLDMPAGTVSWKYAAALKKLEKFGEVE